MTRKQTQTTDNKEFLDLYRTWESVVLASYQRQTGKKAPLDRVIKSNQDQLLDLWETYTGDRRGLSQGLLSQKRNALCYYMGFHLPNVMRCRLMLDREPVIPGKPDQKLKIVDIGCGTGAMSQAIAHFVQGKGFGIAEVNLFDSTGNVLDFARETLDHTLEPKATQITSARLPIEGLDLDRLALDQQPTIIALGYVWNELAQNQRARRKIMDLIGRCRDQEAMIVITEPATEATAQATMILRDEIAELGLHVQYPCPNGAQACPMGTDGKDWCYSEFAWSAPNSFKWVDQILEINRQVLGCSGYIFYGKPRSSKQSRIVGRPTRKGQPGVFDYLICDGTALKKTKGQPSRQILRGEILPT